MAAAKVSVTHPVDKYSTIDTQQWPLITTDDNNFFEDLSTTVKGELQKEKTKTKMNTHSQVQVCCLCNCSV